MSTGSALRLAFREIVGNRSLSVAFVVSLAAGLSGLLTLDAFRDSVASAVRARSKALLAADIAVSARRELTPSEERIVHEVLGGAEESRLVDFFTMASAGNRSRLVQIRAIDERYPFYGKLETRLRSMLEAGADGVWAAPELPAQLGIELGARVKLGDKTFVVKDLVDYDPSGAASFLALAPKVYMHRSHVRATKLLREGSSASYSRLFRLPATGPSAEELAKTLDARLDDPAIQVRLPADASEQIARAATYLGDYLSLVALVGFFLATVGAAYLFRAHVTRRTPEIAVLRALGVTARDAVLVYAWQLVLLALVAAVPAIVATRLLLPATALVLAKFFPFDIVPTLTPANVALAVSLSLLGSLLLCLPILRRVAAVRASSLLQEAGVDVPAGSSVVAWIPAAVFFPLLAVVLSHSPKVGLALSGGFVATALLVALLGNAMVRGLERGVDARDWRLRLPLRRLARSPVATASAFLAIGLATFLVGLLAHVEAGLRAELAAPETSALPAFFLFDVQEDQKDGVLALLAAKKASVANVSPLIRARLATVNGKPFQKEDGSKKSVTREEEMERRFRNRGLNLTYRDKLTESEEIVRGKDFSREIGAEKVSAERDFAERLGLKLGDRLVLDVQGVEVAATIANFRRVRWTSFLPNFFLQFAPGILDDAPKTYLVAVGGLGSEEKLALQSALVESFPNVSILDVAQIVDRILGILTQMHWALRLMALLVLSVGLVVLFAIVRERAESQTRDVALLKAVGAPFGDIRITQALDGALLGLAASFLGAVLAVGGSAILAYVVFDERWAYRLDVTVTSIVAVTALATFAAALATAKSLETPVRDLL